MNMKAVPKAAPTPLPELETYLQPSPSCFVEVGAAKAVNDISQVYSLIYHTKIARR